MTQQSSTEQSLEQQVYQILSQVIDPEIGENVVDLGLVYGIQIESNHISIALTMTSAACPMGEMLLDDIAITLKRNLSSHLEFDIQVVWNPPWDPEMISPAAKQRLGWD